MGELVEALDKPVGDRVLQAMAQAYPDPVDLGLLSMVLSCDGAALQDAVSTLVHSGLARARSVSDPGGAMQWQSPGITDKGMAVADGLAANAEEATALLDHLEAAALRQLLTQRIRGSRLPATQAEELRESLDEVSDQALVDAAKVWAHQTVSDWRALAIVMRHDSGRTAGAAQ